MTTIIVDDEPQSHLFLRKLLSKNYSDIEVLSSAYSVKEGYEQVIKFHPDILFLDIELSDGLGFELLKKIPEPDFQVIFISAFQHYALMAIEFGAFAFLLKPIGIKVLDQALNKARKRAKEKFNLKQFDLLRQLLEDLEQEKLPARMSISVMEGVIFFDIKDIIRLEAQKNYTLFVLENPAKNILASTNIGNYLRHFMHYSEFKQVHRSHLVNMNKVVKFVRSESYLLMKNNDRVPVSRGYRDGF